MSRRDDERAAARSGHWSESSPNVSGVCVPGVGIEPTYSFEWGILSPLRLPFRHPGLGCAASMVPDARGDGNARSLCGLVDAVARGSAAMREMGRRKTKTAARSAAVGWRPGSESNRARRTPQLRLRTNAPPRAMKTKRRDGGLGRNRTGVHGFAGRCMTTLPPGR